MAKVNSVLGKVGKVYCKHYVLNNGKVCEPIPFFEKLEQCKKCKKIE